MEISNKQRVMSSCGVRVVLSVIAATGALLAQGGYAVGQSIFEGKGMCLNCHRVAGKGSRLGRDLSDIGVLRTREALEKSLLMPNSESQPQDMYYRVVTSDGVTVTGKLYNQDIFSVQMMNSQERLVSFQKSKLKEHGFVPGPLMPSYEGKLSKEELTEVIDYLVSLKGVVKQ